MKVVESLLSPPLGGLDHPLMWEWGFSLPLGGFEVAWASPYPFEGGSATP